MIPCFLCGQDASTGWIQGFSPAPDSQKMALCALHDNEKNRNLVALSWQSFLRKGLAEQLDQAKNRGGSGLYLTTVRFLAGGMLSFLCTLCEPTPQGTLRIVGADGQTTFIPMQHVREFTVKPHGQSSTSQAPSSISTEKQPSELSALQESEANKKALLLALGEQESEKGSTSGAGANASENVSETETTVHRGEADSRKTEKTSPEAAPLSQPDPFTDLPVPYLSPLPKK